MWSLLRGPGLGGWKKQRTEHHGALQKPVLYGAQAGCWEPVYAVWSNPHHSPLYRKEN